MLVVVVIVVVVAVVLVVVVVVVVVALEGIHEASDFKPSSPTLVERRLSPEVWLHSGVRH